MDSPHFCECYLLRKRNQVEMHQSILFFIRRSASEEIISEESNLLGLIPEPADQREGKYPTPATSSHPLPPEGKKKLRNTCEVHCPGAQAL